MKLDNIFTRNQTKSKDKQQRVWRVTGRVSVRGLVRRATGKIMVLRGVRERCIIYCVYDHNNSAGDDAGENHDDITLLVTVVVVVVMMTVMGTCDVGGNTETQKHGEAGKRSEAACCSDSVY